MTQPTRQYQSAPPLAQRGRAESLPSPTLNWQAVRQWAAPLALLVVVIGLYVLQSLFATTSELEIARLAKDRDTIMHRNTQLAAEIAELERPSRIRERALFLGLVDINKTIRLPVTVGAADMDDTWSTAVVVEIPWWQRLLTDIARRVTDVTQ